jgi:hypothetical protein
MEPVFKEMFLFVFDNSVIPFLLFAIMPWYGLLALK